MKNFLKRRFRRFAADDTGTITVESILILPVVMWAFVATFVYYDAFASRTASQRAAYTISDSIGRQQNDVLTPEDLESYNRIFGYLSKTQRDTRLRVSSVVWNPGDELYEIVWSYATNEGIPMTEADLTPELVARLPVLPQRESAYIVETSVNFVPLTEALPLSGIILRRQTLREFIVSRPRFSPQLRFDDGTGLVGTTFPTCDDPGVICGTEDPGA